VIWVELLSRHGQVASRFRCAGPELRIGRGYRNEIVLDDPAVAPEHLRVTQGEDGAIIVEALDPAHGFAIAGTPRDRSLVDGDTVLRIGHTLLRIRGADYVVPAASAVVVQHTPWPMLAVLVVAGLALNGLTAWLDETTEPRLARDVASLLGSDLVVLLWASLWALFSRIFSGQARFSRNLAIAFGGFLVYTVYYFLAEDFAFSFSSPVIAGDLSVGFWLLLGTICFFHLQAISPARRGVKAAVLAVLVAGGIGMQLANQLDQLKNGLQPAIARTTFPPAFRLARPKSEDQFFAGVAALKDKLDDDRDAAVR
jgi:FHA domain-containing protein